MATLIQLARQGRTVLTSIHQPSSQVFQAFDKLFLIADGRPVYVGPPKAAADYFEALGYAMPEQYNAADFVMDVVNDPQARVTLADIFASRAEETLALPPIDFVPTNGATFSYAGGAL